MSEAGEWSFLGGHGGYRSHVKVTGSKLGDLNSVPTCSSLNLKRTTFKVGDMR